MVYYDESNLALVCEPPIKTQANTNTNELTQRDLQVLSAMLNRLIAHYEKETISKKGSINYLFSRCDPNNKETKYVFFNMNKLKDDLRFIRNRKSKLAEIQRKIKRQIANG